MQMNSFISPKIHYWTLKELVLHNGICLSNLLFICQENTCLNQDNNLYFIHFFFLI